MPRAARRDPSIAMLYSCMKRFVAYIGMLDASVASSDKSMHRFEDVCRPALPCHHKIIRTPVLLLCHEQPGATHPQIFCDYAEVWYGTKIYLRLYWLDSWGYMVLKSGIVPIFVGTVGLGSVLICNNTNYRRDRGDG